MRPGARATLLIISPRFPFRYRRVTVTVPQISLHAAFYLRKHNLVEYGFRLPSACDNRLTWEEFARPVGQTVSVTAGGPSSSQAGGSSSSR